ncbi:MAG: acyltransferase [Bacteroidia bacterium]|nr:acyltransferase [Bacteroidia bacterium]MCC7532423.1 acyltransferase [Bacteroidia bacterium]
MLNKVIYVIMHYFLKKYQLELYRQYKKKYKISSSFIFNGKDIILSGQGNIVLGSNTYIGSNSSISSNKGYNAIIGNNCAISHNVRIYNNSYHTDSDFNQPNRLVKHGNVTIGDGVWVGANVVILPGVHIGSNYVIGANSVVNKDIPNNFVASGIPCKPIRLKKSKNVC